MTISRDKYLDIKSRLTRKGFKVKDVAARAGVADSTVSVVLTGKGPSKKIQEVIADMLGVKVSDLWPDDRKAKAKKAA